MTGPILPQISEPSVGNPGWNPKFKAVLDRVNQLPEIVLDALADRITTSGMMVNYDPSSRQFTFIGGGGAGSTDLEAVLDFLATNLKINGSTGTYDDPNNTLNFAVAAGGSSQIVFVTQAEYDAIVTPDPAKLYVVTDGVQAGDGSPAPFMNDMLCWSVDPASASSSTVITKGTVYLVKVNLPEDATISSILAQISTAGATLSACFAAVFDMAGVRKGITADQSTNWQSGGSKVMSLGSSFAGKAGEYYIAFLVGNSSTTAPAFARGSDSSATNLGLSAGRFRSCTSGSGLTAMPSSVTLGSTTASPTSILAGLK